MSFTTNDEAQLRRLAVSYARGVDRRDRALFLSAFHPAATLIVASGQVLKGHDEIGQVTEGIKRFGTTFHFPGQSAYEPPDEGLDPGGTARGEVYCIAHHWTEGRSALTMYIRYQDIYRRTDAGWLITSRRVVVDAQTKERTPTEEGEQADGSRAP